MTILKTKYELRKWRQTKENSIGYVPTMGALHEGHLSLIKKSKLNNKNTIVSIFVNPTQFCAGEDFNKYPRNYEKDTKLCEENGVDALFIPNIDEMYSSLEDETVVSPPKHLSSVFEGAVRKGHFDGVLRVVIKLFNLIKPTNAYFGKKDAQQLIIIKKMIEDMFMDINIIGCDIIRDNNNLALSSRNVYLSKKEYELALKIPQSLDLVIQEIKNGQTQSNILENIAIKHLSGIDIDYCKVVDFNLRDISSIKINETIMLLAVKIGNTRLIDNIWI